jgi:hypothetical protein
MRCIKFKKVKFCPVKFSTVKLCPVKFCPGLQLQVMPSKSGSHKVYVYMYITYKVDNNWIYMQNIQTRFGVHPQKTMNTVLAISNNIHYVVQIRSHNSQLWYNQTDKTLIILRFPVQYRFFFIYWTFTRGNFVEILLNY